MLAVRIKELDAVAYLLRQEPLGRSAGAEEYQLLADALKAIDQACAELHQLEDMLEAVVVDDHPEFDPLRSFRFEAQYVDGTSVRVAGLTHAAAMDRLATCDDGELPLPMWARVVCGGEVIGETSFVSSGVEE